MFSPFCGLGQLPPFVDLSSFFLPWTRATSSCGLEQLPQIFVQVCLPFTNDESTVQTQLLARTNFPFQPRCFIGTWNLDLLPTVANIIHLVLHSVFFTSGTPWLRRTRGTPILNTFPGVLTSCTWCCILFSSHQAPTGCEGLVAPKF